MALPALGGLGGLFSAIIPLVGMMMGGGGQQAPAPAPAPPPPPVPEPEIEPEDAATRDAAKRRYLSRQEDRKEENLIALDKEDKSKYVKPKTLLAGS